MPADVLGAAFAAWRLEKQDRLCRKISDPVQPITGRYLSLPFQSAHLSTSNAESTFIKPARPFMYAVIVVLLAFVASASAFVGPSVVRPSSSLQMVSV